MSRGEHLERLRLERDAVAVHRLGPRVMAELLIELGQAHGIEGDVAARLHGYATRLTPEMLAVTGGDRMILRPLLLVPQP